MGAAGAAGVAVRCASWPPCRALRTPHPSRRCCASLPLHVSGGGAGGPLAAGRWAHRRRARCAEPAERGARRSRLCCLAAALQCWAGPIDLIRWRAVVQGAGSGHPLTRAAACPAPAAAAPRPTNGAPAAPYPPTCLQQDELSTGKDSSTHSALFDLELSARGAGNRAADYLARLNPSVHDESTHNGSTHASGDPSVRLPSGLLQRIIYLGRPVAEFELDVSAGARLGAPGV